MKAPSVRRRERPPGGDVSLDIPCPQLPSKLKPTCHGRGGERVKDALRGPRESAGSAGCIFFHSLIRGSAGLTQVPRSLTSLRLEPCRGYQSQQRGPDVNISSRRTQRNVSGKIELNGKFLPERLEKLAIVLPVNCELQGLRKVQPVSVVSRIREAPTQLQLSTKDCRQAVMAGEGCCFPQWRNH